MAFCICSLEGNCAGSWEGQSQQGDCTAKPISLPERLLTWSNRGCFSPGWQKMPVSSMHTLLQAQS